MSEPIADSETTLDCSSNQYPKCPYCGYEDDEFLMEGGPFPKEDGDEMWYDCPECDRRYQIRGHTEHSFTTYKEADPAVADPDWQNKYKQENP